MTNISGRIAKGILKLKEEKKELEKEREILKKKIDINREEISQMGKQVSGDKKFFWDVVKDYEKRFGVLKKEIEDIRETGERIEEYKIRIKDMVKDFEYLTDRAKNMQHFEKEYKLTAEKTKLRLEKAKDYINDVTEEYEKRFSNVKKAYDEIIAISKEMKEDHGEVVRIKGDFESSIKLLTDFEKRMGTNNSVVKSLEMRISSLDKNLKAALKDIDELVKSESDAAKDIETLRRSYTEDMEKLLDTQKKYLSRPEFVEFKKRVTAMEHQMKTLDEKVGQELDDRMSVESLKLNKDMLETKNHLEDQIKKLSLDLNEIEERLSTPDWILGHLKEVRKKVYHDYEKLTNRVEKLEDKKITKELKMEDLLGSVKDKLTKEFETELSDFFTDMFERKTVELHKDLDEKLRGTYFSDKFSEVRKLREEIAYIQNMNKDLEKKLADIEINSPSSTLQGDIRYLRDKLKELEYGLDQLKAKQPSEAVMPTLADYDRRLKLLEGKIGDDSKSSLGTMMATLENHENRVAQLEKESKEPHLVVSEEDEGEITDLKQLIDMSSKAIEAHDKKISNLEAAIGEKTPEGGPALKNEKLDSINKTLTGILEGLEMFTTRLQRLEERTKPFGAAPMVTIDDRPAAAEMEQQPKKELKEVEDLGMIKDKTKKEGPDELTPQEPELEADDLLKELGTLKKNLEKFKS